MTDFASDHNLKNEVGLKHGIVVSDNLYGNYSFSGRLLNLGNSRRVYNLMSGNISKYPINIFNYKYSIGSGKNRKNYAFTICELSIYKVQFPHIFLRSRSMRRHFPKDNLGLDKDVKIKLEDQFNKNFELYCTHNYEIETLQIFTNKILSLLQKEASNFSVELSDNKIYFYDDKIIKKRIDLESLYNIVKKVLVSSGDSISRLHDDLEAMHEFYRK